LKTSAWVRKGKEALGSGGGKNMTSGSLWVNRRCDETDDKGSGSSQPNNKKKPKKKKTKKQNTKQKKTNPTQKTTQNPKKTPHTKKKKMHEEIEHRLSWTTWGPVSGTEKRIERLPIMWGE